MDVSFSKLKCGKWRSITCYSRDALSLATSNLHHSPTQGHPPVHTNLSTHPSRFPQLKMRPPISISSRTLRPILQSSLPHLYKVRYSTCKMSTSPTPVFSSTYPSAQGTAGLSPLLKSNGGKWTLIENGKGVERGFKFKTFKKTWVRLFRLLFFSFSLKNDLFCCGMRGIVWSISQMAGYGIWFAVF